MERIMAAILIQMVKDWEKENRRSEIKKFLGSEWFKIISNSLEINPVSVKQKLLAGKYDKHQNMRAVYR